MYSKILLLLEFIILSAALFATNNYAQDEEEEYYSIYDEYSQNYDEEYFKANAVKINAINKMIEENKRILSPHALPEIKDLDRSRLLASETNTGFELATFTMSAYGSNPFCTCYK